MDVRRGVRLDHFGHSTWPGRVGFWEIWVKVLGLTLTRSKSSRKPGRLASRWVSFHENGSFQVNLLHHESKGRDFHGPQAACSVAMASVEERTQEVRLGMHLAEVGKLRI